jgi:hypothetical protein
MTEPVVFETVTVTGKREVDVPEGSLYLRKATLLLVQGTQALDLSEMHFTFATVQEDEESPSNCAIRVFNLSPKTEDTIRNEYSRVVINAGYEKAAFGLIFDGTIIQFRKGRLNATTTYLDILTNDGDVAYNFAMVARNAAAGVTRKERLDIAISAMNSKGVTAGELMVDAAGGILPRGKVLFGLARGVIRSEVQTIGATWTIQNGKVNVIPLDGYLPTEAVVLTADTGLIGRAEQTSDGIRVKCLLNPKIIIGGLVKIDNASINQTIQKDGMGPPGGGAMLAYNQYAGLQQYASIAADGLYRVYVAEHVGDNRGQDWYTNLVCLTVNPVTNKVKPYG